MKKTIYIITLALAIVYISGCSKLEDFGTTNVNPAATNTPITAALLTNVLSGIGGYATHLVRASLYCQYFSETQYPGCFMLFDLNHGFSDGKLFRSHCTIWQNIIINNTDEATKATAALNGANENQIAIARILKAYIFLDDY